MTVPGKTATLTLLLTVLSACNLTQNCPPGTIPAVPAAPPAPPTPPDPPFPDIQNIVRDAQFACSGKRAGDAVVRAPDAYTTVKGHCEQSGGQLWFSVDEVNINKTQAGDNK